MIVLTVFLMAAAGAVAALISGLLLRSSPGALKVRNFRGVEVPAVGGVVLVATIISTEVILTLAALVRTGSLESVSPTSPSALQSTFLSFDHVGILILALGFFVLGAIDDLGGAGQARGFRGHFAALRKGRLTGGGIKALGGGALAFVVAGLWELELVPALIDALAIALVANLLNLLDLRPGRATKAFLLAWIPLAIMAVHSPFLPVSGAAAAAAAVWLVVDLSERGMLGDSGANMLGAVLGAGFVLVVSMPVRMIILLALVLLTLLSEWKSFTKMIDSVAPLRWLDRVGRRAPYA